MSSGARRPSSRRWILPLGLLVLSGCLWDPGQCGPVAQIPDGQYVSDDACSPPHAEGAASGLRLRLDDEAGYVTIEYEVDDGDQTRRVEERWKIVARSGEPRSR